MFVELGCYLFVCLFVCRWVETADLLFEPQIWFRDHRWAGRGREWQVNCVYCESRAYCQMWRECPQGSVGHVSVLCRIARAGRAQCPGPLGVGFEMEKYVPAPPFPPFRVEGKPVFFRERARWSTTAELCCMSASACMIHTGFLCIESFCFSAYHEMAENKVICLKVFRGTLQRKVVTNLS